MPLPFSEANAVPTGKPHTTNNKPATTPHDPSVAAADSNESLAAIAEQPTTLAVDKTEPFEVVKQTIDDLEAQGLLMVFDRHDQVAKRLTGDLAAAGILQETRFVESELLQAGTPPSQQEAYSQR